MANFGDSDTKPLWGLGNSPGFLLVGAHRVVATGSSGAVATSYGVPGVSVSRAALGVYTCSYPAAGELRIGFNLEVTAASGAAIIKGVSKDSAAGVASFEVLNSVGARVDLSNGDAASIWFYVSPSGR